MDKKLYLSEDRKFLGVCSGIAEYFGFDPTILRIIWVLLVLLYGSGILAYFIAYFVIPKRPNI